MVNYGILKPYQLCFFVDAKRLEPEPKIISKLVNELSGESESFIPRTFQEIGVVNSQRLGLRSLDNHWEIAIGTDRINIEWRPTFTKDGPELSVPKNFEAKCTEFLGIIYPLVGKKGYRLSYIGGGLFPEMSNDELDSNLEKLLIPPPFYSKNVPFEWNSRFVASKEITIARRKESLNVITTIDRIAGQIVTPSGNQRFDRIELSFDINTKAPNDSERFLPTHFKEFYTKTEEIRISIATEIENVINSKN